MYKDLNGDTRYKINLHMHTKNSDGALSPSDAIALYKNAGYDAVALTEHWKHTEDGYIDGMRIISGCEYDVNEELTGYKNVYHILSLCCKCDPGIEKSGATVGGIVNAIRAAGGISVLAHPAWSLNGDAEIMAINGIEGIEIYNSASGVKANVRPYSGGVVDVLALKGRYYPLYATDDSHWYDGEAALSNIMLKAKSLDADDVRQALRQGDFYSTQGPELHIALDGERVVVRSSPVEKVAFFSNLVYDRNRVVYGHDMTEAVYQPTKEGMTYVRAEAYDKYGRTAFSNIITVKSEK